MNHTFFRRTILQGVWATILLMFAVKGSAQYTNGIYAEFNTSMGNYTCALYYAESPKAVGSFIGLATGQRAWLDLPSGIVKTNPFYNGIIFHRVITNFVIQAGSPNGLGTDGPGYAFVDEITNTLRFDSFGVLAMANSGPDSNGSQFFVTTSPQPSLNNGYTVLENSTAAPMWFMPLTTSLPMQPTNRWPTYLSITSQSAVSEVRQMDLISTPKDCRS
ncbi:MAG: peptidylprolyl isomerase [Limisphaerales bacterium]